MKHERIGRDPDVMMGKPVVKGTRITVELILRKCAAGMSTAEIVEAYPHVSEEDVRAALDYARTTCGASASSRQNRRGVPVRHAPS